MNIKFCYQYRDGANYKTYREIVFTNKINLTLTLIKSKIVSNLFEERWFYSTYFNLPDLHFKEYDWNPEIDHDWHEFIDVEETAEPAENVDIQEFLSNIKP